MRLGSERRAKRCDEGKPYASQLNGFELHAGSLSRDSASVARQVEAEAEVGELVAQTDLRAASALFATVWGSAPDGAPVSPELLRALSHTGNYVAGVRIGPALVGASVGFLAHTHGVTTLHSHITGLAPEAQRKGLGYLLKLHQRAWAVDRGLTEITWTFDPLVRRNAYFNLTKLGAEGTGFQVNFYGDMVDQVNRGDESDRCEVTWNLTTDGRLAHRAGASPDLDIAVWRDAGGVAVLEEGDDGQPRRRPLSGSVRLCWIPDDAVALRSSAPQLARRWRLALRDTFGESIADGFVATAMTRSGWYVLEQR